MSKFGKFDSNKLQQYAQAVGNVNLRIERRISTLMQRDVSFFFLLTLVWTYTSPQAALNRCSFSSSLT